MGAAARHPFPPFSVGAGVPDGPLPRPPPDVGATLAVARPPSHRNDMSQGTFSCPPSRHSVIANQSSDWRGNPQPPSLAPSGERAGTAKDRD